MVSEYRKIWSEFLNCLVASYSHVLVQNILCRFRRSEEKLLENNDHAMSSLQSDEIPFSRRIERNPKKNRTASLQVFASLGSM
mmetsp:Transcript_23352/g.44227  ORF Transcript_23352/g.44227 Transcript_23352/m.44227 type:complete len:83 (-) Transcript_23352:117-365(-)